MRGQRIRQTPTCATILTATHTIAVVGASPNPARPSHGVMGYLHPPRLSRHPDQSGSCRRGDFRSDRPCAVGGRAGADRHCRHLPPRRRPGGVVDEALALSPLPKAIWMQLGLRDDAAAVTGEGGRAQRRHGSLHQDRARPAGALTTRAKSFRSRRRLLAAFALDSTARRLGIAPAADATTAPRRRRERNDE